MRLLFITSRVPFPLDKGDKLRAYHQLKELSRFHEICLFSLSDLKPRPEDLSELRKICSRVEVFEFSKARLFFNLVRTFFGRKPMQVGYFYNGESLAAFRRLLADFKPEAVYCQLIRTAEYGLLADLPRTLDYMDVFSKGVERRIPKVPFYLRPFFRLEYKRLLRYEKEVFDKFNHLTIISGQDRDLIPHPNHKQIVVIPNGVDLDYFRPVEGVREKEFSILFNGNMSYPPNVESALYLVEEVMPRVWSRYPDLKVLISGTDPVPRIRALASAQVEVSGRVPDVRVNFYKSRILVAPMQSSIGLQNKLMEAMAMKLPCITSTLANNALGANPGTEVLVADTPEGYADCIFKLIENPGLAHEIAEKGYTFVSRNFNWRRTGEMLGHLIDPGAAEKAL